ncbi:hypothetical protein ACCS75_14745 [Rhizobium ruizarguesonis]
MTDIRRRWQQSENGAAKAAPFSLQVSFIIKAPCCLAPAWQAAFERVIAVRSASDPCADFNAASKKLKRVAIFQIRSSRFRSLFLRMSLSQNRRTLLRDML